MREIKFRAWDNKRRLFHWGISNICLTLGGSLMWQSGYKSPDFLDQGESEQFVLMQYTGLKDKNGKEIYEGDRIQWQEPWDTKPTGHIHQVTWEDSGYWSLSGYNIAGATVIGNIYEKPELLK